MRRPFAVILMDVQMPVMDGYETARMIRLRKDCESTPIIFITAHTRDEADTDAYASGAVDFIWAPIVPSVLRAKVAIFVELYPEVAGARALARASSATARRTRARCSTTWRTASSRSAATG